MTAPAPPAACPGMCEPTALANLGSGVLRCPACQTMWVATPDGDGTRLTRLAAVHQALREQAHRARPSGTNFTSDARDIITAIEALLDEHGRDGDGATWRRLAVEVVEDALYSTEAAARADADAAHAETMPSRDTVTEAAIAADLLHRAVHGKTWPLRLCGHAGCQALRRLLDAVP